MSRRTISRRRRLQSCISRSIKTPATRLISATLFAPRRQPFYLIGTFAGLALVLAIVGLYGLISYSVLQRTREIGIRLALGAQREHILRLVLREGAFAAVFGVGIGLIASLLLTRVLASLLYGVTFRDWPLFAGLGLFLM